MRVEVGINRCCGKERYNGGGERICECIVEKDENNIYWSFERTYHGPYRKVLLFPVFNFSLIFAFPLFTYILLQLFVDILKIYLVRPLVILILILILSGRMHFILGFGFNIY
jgi:hypothetical protein